MNEDRDIWGFDASLSTLYNVMTGKEEVIAFQLESHGMRCTRNMSEKVLAFY